MTSMTLRSLRTSSVETASLRRRISVLPTGSFNTVPNYQKLWAFSATRAEAAAAAERAAGFGEPDSREPNIASGSAFIRRKTVLQGLA